MIARYLEPSLVKTKYLKPSVLKIDMQLIPFSTMKLKKYFKLKNRNLAPIFIIEIYHLAFQHCKRKADF